MAKSGVVLAVVLVAGAFAGGLGVGLVAGDAPHAPDVDPSLADPSPADPVRESGADETAPSASADTAERRRRREEDAPPAAVAPSESESGSGTITGTVKTVGGQPVEGVQVVSRPQSDSSNKSTRRPQPFEERDLGELVRELEERYHRTRRLRREGSTAPDGAYAIVGLPDGKHRLTLKKKGYRFDPAPDSPGHVGSAGDALDFTATPVVAVTMDVRMPDGSAPESALVSVKRGSPQGGMTTKNERWYRDDPAIDIVPGTYIVRASVSGETPLRSKDVPLVVSETTPAATVLLELSGAPMVRVNLMFAEGERWPAARLRLLRTARGARRDLERLRREGRTTHVSSRTKDFNDVAPGTYVVGVQFSNGPIVASQEVEVRDGPAVVDLSIPPREREEYAVLEVSDPAGKPLADAAFSTGVRRGGSSSSGGRGVLAKGAGTYWVMHRDSNQVSGHGTDETVWWIDVSSAAYGSQRVEYHDTSATVLRVQFEEPAALDVQLVAFVGRGLDGLLSITTGAKGSQSNSHRTRRSSDPQIDEAGRYRVPVLAPGEHDVIVSIRHGHMATEIARRSVLLRSGENDVSIPLPALHTLTVELSGAAAVGTVGAYMMDRNRRLFMPPRAADEAGRVVFEHLPEGEYTVQVYNVKDVKDINPRKVKLPEKSVVRFQ